MGGKGVGRAWRGRRGRGGIGSVGATNILTPFLWSRSVQTCDSKIAVASLNRPLCATVFFTSG